MKDHLTQLILITLNLSTIHSTRKLSAVFKSKYLCLGYWSLLRVLKYVGVFGGGEKVRNKDRMQTQDFTKNRTIHILHLLLNISPFDLISLLVTTRQ